MKLSRDKVTDLSQTADGAQPVTPGDLVRVGDRIVVLYSDRGEPGVVDYDDLCFDFVQGAEVRSLGDVFGSDDLDAPSTPKTNSSSLPSNQAATSGDADELVVEHAHLGT